MALAVVHLHSPVGALVARTAPRIRPDSTLMYAGRQMRAMNTSALLVGHDHPSIVTERDLARAVALGYQPETEVEGLATPLPVSVPADTHVVTAAALMLNHEVRHLVVEMPGGDGIVSIRQIMAVLLQAASPDLWLNALRIRVDMTQAWTP